MSHPYILETKGLTKEFRGFVAVHDVDLQIEEGSIHVLIGPNGAGKTTCFNLLTKFLAPTAGRIYFDSEDITQESPFKTARRGVVRSFQISAVFPHMTALNNVRVGLQRHSGSQYRFWESGSKLDQLNHEAHGLLEQVGLGECANHLVADLPYGRKRALEIATTLAMRPRLMLLDEPTQGMGHEDVGRVTELIKEVAVGRTILMVEHNMNVVAKIADRISVLSRGSILAEGTYEDVSKNKAVIEAYMGAADESREVSP